jgi:hypothetical protein
MPWVFRRCLLMSKPGRSLRHSDSAIGGHTTSSPEPTCVRSLTDPLTPRKDIGHFQLVAQSSWKDGTPRMVVPRYCSFRSPECQIGSISDSEPGTCLDVRRPVSQTCRSAQYCLFLKKLLGSCFLEHAISGHFHPRTQHIVTPQPWVRWTPRKISFWGDVTKLSKRQICPGLPFRQILHVQENLRSNGARNTATPWISRSLGIEDRQNKPWPTWFFYVEKNVPQVRASCRCIGVQMLCEEKLTGCCTGLSW